MAQTHPDTELIKPVPAREKGALAYILTFAFFIALTAINLLVGLRVLRNPGSFPSSYWDMRWMIIFGVAFLVVGLLALLSQNKALFVLTITGIAVLVILPIFTIGAGIAYLVLILLVVIACGAGETFLGWILGSRMQPGMERFVLSLLLGLGFLAILVMIQGMLFAYSALVTWAGLAVLTLVFVLPNIKRWYLEIKRYSASRRSDKPKDGWSGWVAGLAILAILWAPSWLIALAPANRYDEMTYHLVAPLFYLSKGGIVPYPEGSVGYWMHYAEMLYTLALQTAGQPLPRMLHLLMGGLSGLLIFLTGRRLVNTRVGIAAALLFLAVPAVGYESGTAYIDLFVTAYTTAFGFTLLLWWQEQNPRWLLVAGMLGGIGLGIKLTAGPMLAGLILTFVIASLVTHRFSKALPWTGGMIVLIITLALPWLIRDTLWTGDPFYPYGGMFMDRVTSTDSVAGTSKLIKLLRYPVDLVLDSHRYYHEAPGGFASAISLLAIPFFYFLPAFSRKVKTIGLSLLFANLLALGIMLLVNNTLLRYALPIFPWLAVCAALNLEGVYVWFSNREHKWGLTVLGLTFLVYIFSTRAPLVLRPYDNLPQRFPLSYFLGRESRETYLSRTVPVYDAFRFIDSQPNGPHRIFSVGNELRLYSNSRIDGIYDVPEVHEFTSQARTPAELAQTMGDHGYDYILLNQPEVDYVQWKYVEPYPVLQDPDFWNTYGEMVFEKNGVYVYRFDPSGVNLPPAVNLLQNNSFEIVQPANDFAGWDEYGAVEVSDEAYHGEQSVLLYAPLSLKGAGYIVQRVPVKELGLYTVGYWLKADTTAVFLIRVDWLDENQRVINSDQQWKNVSDDWNWYSLSLQAPEGARFAEIYASLGNINNAWADDVCFARGQRCQNY